MVDQTITGCELLAEQDLPESLPDGFSISRLVGDASSRSYFRIHTPSGETLILMKMPEPFEEKQFPYLDVYHLLRGRNIAVAQAHFLKPEKGYVFLQDLGDDTLYEKYNAWSEQARLHFLLKSLNILREIELTVPASTLAFDTEKFSWELNFFLEHYLLGYRQQELSSDEIQAYREQFTKLSQELADRPRVFCHRDYHSRNLMLWQDELYVIDFQDARLGPATYDLASLCYDSYLQHSPEILGHLEKYFFTYHPDPDLQRWEYPRMSLQRNLKALGTFGFQASKLGRDFYVQFMEPTAGYARRHLARLPEYAELSKLLQRHL